MMPESPLKNPEAGPSPERRKLRRLAIIANDQARVDEVVASFAQAGDMVAPEWFSTPDDLLASDRSLRYEAVIYYTTHADSHGESRLRAALGPDTAFFCVAA